MANERVEGIVLSVRKHKEKDYIVQFFSKDYGKLGFYLRGSKKPNWSSKKLTFPFTQGIVITDYKEEGLLFIKGTQNLESPLEFFGDIEKTAYSTYIGQLIEAAVEDRQPEADLYDQVILAIDLMKKDYDEEIITNIFEVHLLDWFGVQPEWRACVICGQMEGAFDYSPKYKGLLCQDHFHLDMHRYHAQPRAMHLIRLFSQISLDQVSSIQVSRETKREIRRIIDMLYDELVGIRLKSKSFIDQMQEWSQVLEDPKEE